MNRNQPRQHVGLELPASRTIRNKFLLFQTTNLCHFSYGIPSKLIPPETQENSYRKFHVFYVSEKWKILLLAQTLIKKTFFLANGAEFSLSYPFLKCITQRGQNMTELEKKFQPHKDRDNPGVTSISWSPTSQQVLMRNSQKVYCLRISFIICCR